MLKFYSSIASSSASRRVVARTLTTVEQESTKMDTSKGQPPKVQPSKEDVDQPFSTGDETKNKRKHVFRRNRVELVGGVAEAPIQRVTRSGGDYVTSNMITNAEFRHQGVSVSDRIHCQVITRDDGARMGRVATVNAEVVQPLAKMRPRVDCEIESDSH